ncbi:MAG: membrane protein [Acidimicrobiales bacterium]|nr:MAG: membrane protein [Acidimicrobiales bacterium]
MEIVLLLGRIVFSVIFIGSGIGQLADEESTTATAEGAGLPNAKLMGQISGVFFGLGGIAIALGIFTDLAFLLTGVLVMIAAFTIHPFWKMEGEAQMMQMPNFMKNLTIFGACLMGFAFYSTFGSYEGVADGYQIVGSLFEFDFNDVIKAP